MATRIEASELERLLADDAVPDEAIAPYLKPASFRSLPFEPMLVINEATVTGSPSRGIFGLTVSALNARSNRRRAAAYEARIQGGWKGLKLLAEGDSWFQYPILLRDLIDNLCDTYAIYSIAEAGDTLANMVRGTAHIEDLIRTHGFDGLLFSAGGNDIAGDALVSYLHPPPVAGKAPQDFIAGAFDAFLETSKTRVEGVVSRLTGSFPDLHIFCHGYDWPLPRNHGVWLEPAFLNRRVPETLRGLVLRQMIDRYYDMLRQVASKAPGRVHVVDCRGAVGALDQWFDELHPINPGFTRAANRFRAEINKSFGISASRGGMNAHISWRPYEETTGARVHSRLFPTGALISIGRGADREILLDDSRVSRNHAQLSVGVEDVGIEDLGSSNGTLLDGRRITQARWRPGQTVRIGHIQFDLDFVAMETATDAASMTPTGPPEAPQGQNHGPVPTQFLPVRQEPEPMPVQALIGAAAQRPGPDLPLQRLEIVIARGSIVDQQASAVAIGAFEGVNPVATRGAARSIDESTDGLLTAVLETATIDSRLGRVTLLPLPAERGTPRSLLLTGLGLAGSFLPKALETAGENLARFLVATRIFDLATVATGSSSGFALKDCVESLLAGLLRGLRQADGGREFRGITLCEINKDRHAELQRAVGALAASGAFAAQGFDVNIVIQSAPVGEPRQSASAIVPVVPVLWMTPVYLDVSMVAARDLKYCLLPATGADAALPLFNHKVDDGLVRRIDDARKNPSSPVFDVEFGQSMADAYLPAELQQSISRSLAGTRGHIVILHDPDSSVIPWEASYWGDGYPALDFGISRVYKSAIGQSKRRYAIEPGAPLRMLMIQNPTGDLKGAEQEAKEITELFRVHGSAITVLRQKEATKAAVLAELKSGQYEILHFSGHAQFHENASEHSGIVLYDDRPVMDAKPVVLSATDLDQIETVPHLIFLNACQSGRLRDLASIDEERGAEPPLTKHASLAEGFIIGGVRNLVGTYWRVQDREALEFARAFYADLLTFEPLGCAMRAARRKLARQGPREWANYLHFGDPNSLLRKPSPRIG